MGARVSCQCTLFLTVPLTCGLPVYAVLIDHHQCETIFSMALMIFRGKHIIMKFSFCSTIRTLWTFVNIIDQLLQFLSYLWYGCNTFNIKRWISFNGGSYLWKMSYETILYRFVEEELPAPIRSIYTFAANKLHIRFSSSDFVRCSRGRPFYVPLRFFQTPHETSIFHLSYLVNSSSVKFHLFAKEVYVPF